MSSSDVARSLHVTRQTGDRWIRDGKLRAPGAAHGRGYISQGVVAQSVARRLEFYDPRLPS